MAKTYDLRSAKIFYTLPPKTLPITIWPARQRAAVSISFDDGQLSQIKEGLPILERYGIRASLYISPWSIERNAEQWKGVAASGHEIGNHTLTHPCSNSFSLSRDRTLEDMDLRDIEDDIAQASALIWDRLGIAPKTFAYPCGQTFVGRNVAKRFLAGRGYGCEFVNNPALCNLALLSSVSFDNRDFGKIKPWLERTFNEQGWLILVGHHVAEKAEKGKQVTRTAMLEELCVEICRINSGFWVAPVAEVAEWLKQKRDK